MPFISKEEVQAKNLKLKEICKKYSIKAKFSGSNSSTLVCKITAGVIDFFSNAVDCQMQKPYDAYLMNALAICQQEMTMKVNHYWMHEQFSGIALECLQEIKELMQEGNWDNSDIQSDFFDVGWYLSIYIGANKPYKLI